jgi:hypothetical protein
VALTIAAIAVTVLLISGATVVLSYAHLG